MALYRSKLGPVGGGGEGGTREGGIVVDLDPLSAFALMGRGSADTDTGASPNSGVPERLGTAGPVGGTTRATKDRSCSPSPTLAQPRSTEKLLGLGSWRVADLTAPPLPMQVCFFFRCVRATNAVDDGVREQTC